jgi:hypothetical protein
MNNKKAFILFIFMISASFLATLIIQIALITIGN